MFIVIGIMVVAIIIIAIEIPDLRKRKLKKEIWIFSILLSIGVGLCIAQSLKFHIPNPVEGITFVFKPMSDFIRSYLLK